MTEEELIELLEKDRESGFRAAFSMYGKRIYHIAFDFTAKREEAEDVTQEVFLEMFRSLHLFRKEAVLGTWIYRIMANEQVFKGLCQRCNNISLPVNGSDKSLNNADLFFKDQGDCGDSAAASGSIYQHTCLHCFAR